MTVVDKEHNSKNIESIYYLSPVQEGMLFHTLYAPESGVYFEQFSYTLHGNLNILAFEQAWQRLLERHSILRTLFIWENRKKSLQVVRKWVNLPWSNYDWRSLSPVEQQAHLEAFLQADRDKGVELDKAPLMRCTLIKMGENTYQFVWSYHHLLMDGWSMPIIIKEVLTFYEAFKKGQQIYLKPARPYRDYITWLQQQDLSQAEAFWRRTLLGFSSPTPLVVDKAVGNNSNHKQTYEVQYFSLSAEATVALQTFARQNYLTLNTLLQGAWALLLSRYSGEADVIFGATVSTRPTSLEGIESMVGLFINTLPVRVQVSEEAQLLPWLMQLQLQQAEQQQYSYSPLVAIQDWSHVPQGTPLFESIIVFENYPVDASLQEDEDSIVISNFQVFDRTNYPLTIIAGPGLELSIRVSYDTSRFDAATITRMLGHFQTLLKGIVSNPDQQISDLPLLSVAERHQSLVEWNDTQTEYPEFQCIHQLFEAQVELTPEAIAVVFEDQKLTYWELNTRANKIAHHLQAIGVGPEVLVGICVERSIEMVVGLLGILKAGGAYLPLDPAYPFERLSFMLSDAQVKVLLTQQQLVTRLREQKAHLVCLDIDCSAISQESQHNPVSDLQPDNLAYVIYTSGSTGKPKGVMNTHRGISNRLLWMQNAYQLTTADRVLQKTPFSFDVSVWEFFWPLLSGACLVVAKPGGHQDSAYLVRLIAQQKITTIHFVPSMLQVFLEERGLDACGCLRLLFCSGEVLPVELQERFFACIGAELHNLYGPTEAAIDVTFWRCLRPKDVQCQQKSHLRTVPIGRPIANTQIYILDRHLQPVPIGVPGELHIGGAGLARGYLNRPQLTQEKFIPNPFSAGEQGRGGARLYKTGDLARYLDDGNIEFLGRLDHQVKIRGFRIELGEIEAVLSHHQKVRQSVVIAREDTPGNKRLVAYIISGHKPVPTFNELCRFLKEKLPEYMIPSAFVILDALPLTPNGKVDRQALPIPDTISISQQVSFVPPRDPLEQQLAQIWSKVLDVQLMGVRDNFFDLGGHSILAVRLMAQIQQQFGKSLPLATLFGGATIEDLATILRNHSDSSVWSPLVAIQQGSSKRPFFCVPGGGGNVIYFYDLARHLGPDQPFYGLQALGLDGKSKPHTKVEDMASYYIEAIQTVQPQGPYLLGGHSFGCQVAFEMANQLRHQGHEVALLAILDTYAPMTNNKLIGVDWDDARWMTEIASIMERLFGKKLEVSYDALQPLDPEEQLNYLKERLITVNVLPPKVGIAQVRGLVQVFKANSQIHYAPQEVYPTRITLLRSSEVHPEDAANNKLYETISQDLAWGWDKFSTESIEVHFVPGDHITMMTNPYVQVLAARLRTCIEQAHADGGGK